jgi:hypothetical protein
MTGAPAQGCVICRRCNQRCERRAEQDWYKYIYSARRKCTYTFFYGRDVEDERGFSIPSFLPGGGVDP